MKTIASAMAACLLAGCAGSTIESLPANTPGSGTAGVTPASLAYNLPRTLVQVTKTGAKLTMEERLVPDVEHSYLVNYVPSALASDSWTVTVDAQTGFLSSAEVAFDDKTGEIAKSLAKSVGRVATSLSGRAAERAKDLDFVFDPNDPASFERAAAILERELGFDLVCTGACGPSSAPVDKVHDQLLFRHAMPMVLTLCDAAGGGCDTNPPTHVFRLRSVNASPILGVPAPRSAMVQRKAKVTFTNGVPSSVSHTKPSEALALVALPGDIIGAVFGGIVDGLTGRTDIAKQEAALAEQQTARIEALEALVAARKAQGNRGGSGPSTNAPDGAVVPPTGAAPPNLGG